TCGCAHCRRPPLARRHRHEHDCRPGAGAPLRLHPRYPRRSERETPMNWKIRHEGSPQSIDGLELQQVLDGLRDGRWAPADEVMGPGEANWQAIENHPQLAETAADLEPPPPKDHDDETRLDMNPLIDVALVLLVFFILTTTYETIRKVIEAPGTSSQSEKSAL